MMPARMTNPIGPGVLLLAVLSLGSAPAYAQIVDIDLCVKTGSITLADGTTHDIWGYAEKIVGVGCDNAQHVATLPGPVIRATAGDVVTIRVRNRLTAGNLGAPAGVNTSILIPGQDVSCFTGCTPLGEFTAEAAPGSTNTRYRFVAKTGTYIYESGTNPKIQTAMGLHGALVVDSGQIHGPTGLPEAYTRGSSRYDREAILVLSEIDPALNADPLNFEFIVPDPDPINPGNFLQNYQPIYWLINGKDHPLTDAIPAAAGERVLLRYVNGSFTHHSMAALDLHQRIVAREAFELPTIIQAVAETIPAGATADMIPIIRGNAGPLTVFPIYNRNMRLTNASLNTEGGMQTGIEVGALFFSTFNAGTVPGVPGGTLPSLPNPNAYDDADIYKWNGSSFTRVFEARVAGGGAANLAAGADVDGLKVVDADTFYVSFMADGTAVPGLGTVDDEDIVLYDAGTWTVFFNGSDVGLDANDGLDICAFDIDPTGNIIYFSTLGTGASADPSGGTVLGPYDDADIYSYDVTGGTFARVFNGRVGGVGLPNNADIDALKVVDADTFYVSFVRNPGTQVPGVDGDPSTPAEDPVEDEDVVRIDGTAPPFTATLFFDGSEAGGSPGLGASAGQDIDALDL